MERRHRPLLLLQEVGFVVFLDEELNASHPHLAFVHTRRHQVEDVFVDVVLQNQTKTALLLKTNNKNSNTLLCFVNTENKVYEFCAQAF